MLWLFMSIAFVFNVVSWLIQVGKRTKNKTEARYDNLQANVATVCVVAAVSSFFWHIIDANNISAGVNIAGNTLSGLFLWSMFFANRRIRNQEKLISPR